MLNPPSVGRSTGQAAPLPNGGAPAAGFASQWFIDVRLFGAVGDGVNDDTSAIQAAETARAAANIGLLIFPTTGAHYKITDNITLGSNVDIDGGGIIKQYTDGKSVFVATNQDSITVGGVRLLGNGAASNQASVGGCIGVDFTGCSNIRLNKTQLWRWKYHPVRLSGCADIWIDGLRVFESCATVILRGCSHVHIAKPRLKNPATPAATFTVALALDSTDGHTYGYCTDVSISDVHMTGYVNAQALLVHAGERVSIDGGVLNDVLSGVSINPTALTYATLTAQFVQPAVGATVQAQVDASAALLIGQTVFIATGGLYAVASKPDATHVVLNNLGHTIRNAAVGATVANSSTIQPGDSILDITVDGVVVVGTSTAGAVSGSNAPLIMQAGSGTPDIINATVQDIVIRNGNAILKGDTGGGMLFGWVQGLTVTGCVVDRCYGSAIVLNTNCQSVNIGDNTCKNTINSVGNNRWGIYVVGTGCTGEIRDNVIKNVAQGFRSDVAADLIVENNYYDSDVTVPWSLLGLAGDPIVEGIGHYTAGDTTPTVRLRTRFLLVANAGPITISNLTSSLSGQPVTLTFQDSNTTVAGASFRLMSAFTSAQYATLTLVRDQNTGEWREIARSPGSANFGSQALTAGAATVSSIRDTGLSTGLVHSDNAGNFTSSLAVNADIANGAAIAWSKISPNIVNADVNSAAAIDGSKVNPNFGSQTLTAGSTTVNGFTNQGYGAGVVHAAAGGGTSSSPVVNADVSGTAAIDGTKISPNFGSQTVQTTGNVTAGSSNTLSGGGFFANLNTLGFYGVTPVVRPAAYTMTYSTGTRTNSAPTATAPSTTAASQTSPWGYSTQAQADAIPVAIGALVADVLNLKQTLTQALKDLQLQGLLQ